MPKKGGKKGGKKGKKGKGKKKSGDEIEIREPPGEAVKRLLKAQFRHHSKHEKQASLICWFVEKVVNLVEKNTHFCKILENNFVR